MAVETASAKRSPVGLRMARRYPCPAADLEPAGGLLGDRSRESGAGQGERAVFILLFRSFRTKFIIGPVEGEGPKWGHTLNRKPNGDEHEQEV
jgi:hypothetical protein